MGYVRLVVEDDSGYDRDTTEDKEKDKVWKVSINVFEQV